MRSALGLMVLVLVGCGGPSGEPAPVPVVAQPSPVTAPSSATVAALEARPRMSQFFTVGQQVTFQIIALYTDGTERDVTAEAGLAKVNGADPNNQVAEIVAPGTVIMRGRGWVPVSATFGGVTANGGITVGP